MDVALKTMHIMQQGITSLGQFWIMSKLGNSMSSVEKINVPDMIEVEKSLITLFRFALSSRV